MILYVVLKLLLCPKIEEFRLDVTEMWATENRPEMIGQVYGPQKIGRRKLDVNIGNRNVRK